jgi:hypothetical protein
MKKYQYLILLIAISFNLYCSSSTTEIDRSKNRIQLRFVCDEFDDNFYYQTPLLEKKDLLAVLAELSLSENPAIRFISTNQTEEIMEVNGRRTSWKEAWQVYINGQKISPYDLKKGVRVSEKDKIEIRLEATERVFGIPTKHGESNN